MKEWQDLKKLHLDNFAGNMKTLYLVDTVEKEEHFYLYENGALKSRRAMCASMSATMRCRSIC